MKKEEIHWADWHRFLLGEAPSQFLLEVLIRSIITYFFLLVVLRLLGKRMGGQLTISELAVMLTLGAIVSVPMQVPERGILQGLLVLLCALAFQRGITYLAVKSDKIEHLTQGQGSEIIRDGVMRTDQLRKLKISREQMLAVLRNAQIYNLGEVQRVYIEACGLFSVFKYSEPKAGLSLLPPGDEAAGDELGIVERIMVCSRCGNRVDAPEKPTNPCNNCGHNDWTNAVMAN